MYSQNDAEEFHYYSTISAFAELCEMYGIDACLKELVMTIRIGQAVPEQLHRQKDALETLDRIYTDVLNVVFENCKTEED